MLNGLLNCASVMQSKLPSHVLSPSVCSLCLQDSEDLQHLFFRCPFAEKCWFDLFGSFKINSVFYSDFKKNILQLLIGTNLKEKSRLLWINAIKALLLECWFK